MVHEELSERYRHYSIRRSAEEFDDRIEAEIHIAPPSTPQWKIASEEVVVDDVQELKNEFRKLNTKAKELIDILHKRREQLKRYINDIGGNISVYEGGDMRGNTGFGLFSYETTYTNNRKSAEISVLQKSVSSQGGVSPDSFDMDSMMFEVQMRSSDVGNYFSEKLETECRGFQEVQAVISTWIKEFDEAVNEYEEDQKRRKELRDAMSVPYDDERKETLDKTFSEED